MNRKALQCLAFLMGSINLAAQQGSLTDRIIELGKSDNRTMHHLDVITNRFGGRLTGSDAYENAALWCSSQFKGWGMDVIMDEVGNLPVGFNRGPWFGRLLSDNGMVLHFATPSYTSGTKGVQRGHVLIEPESREEFDRMKGALKGAWVLIGGKNNGWPVDYSLKADSDRKKIIALNDSIARLNNNIRKENYENRDKFQKELIPLNEEPALFYREMCEAGILGIIQSSEVPIVALYDRKNLENMTFGNLPSVCDIKLDEIQYSLIRKMAEERRFFLLEFDIRNHFKPGPVSYHNVIGVIRGTQYPDEYVMVGSHLDALDVATGAVDNGSGVATTMEAARLIMAAGSNPKRTILVCLWAGEEFGLIGSKHWVEANKDKLPKISDYLNRDAGSTVASGITVPEAMYQDFEKICKPLNSINPDFQFKLNKKTNPPRPKPVTPGGSDYGYFAMNGVPAISLDETDSRGNDFRYREIWHTENDMFNKSVSEYLDHTSIVTAVLVFGLANLDHLLSRSGLYADDKDRK